MKEGRGIRQSIQSNIADRERRGVFEELAWVEPEDEGSRRRSPVKVDLIPLAIHMCGCPPEPLAEARTRLGKASFISQLRQQFAGT
jgi:hypothetical protein